MNYAVIMFMILVNMKMPLILAIWIKYLTLYNLTLNMNYNSQKWYTCPCFQLFLLFAASFCFKIMLIPAYYSTDHDVHQNWLRITANKPFT